MDDSQLDASQSSQTLMPDEDRLTAKISAARQPKPPESTKTKRRESRLKSGLVSLISEFTSESEKADKRKLILAAILTLAILGFGAYRAYQFSAGPPVRVLNEID